MQIRSEVAAERLQYPEITFLESNPLIRKADSGHSRTVTGIKLWGDEIRDGIKSPSFENNRVAAHTHKNQCNSIKLSS